MTDHLTAQLCWTTVIWAVIRRMSLAVSHLLQSVCNQKKQEYSLQGGSSLLLWKKHEASHKSSAVSGGLPLCRLCEAGIRQHDPQHAVEVSPPEAEASATPASLLIAAPTAAISSDPAPLAPLEALASIVQDSLWSVLASAGQQLHRWQVVKPHGTLFRHQVGLRQGSEPAAHQTVEGWDDLCPTDMQAMHPQANCAQQLERKMATSRSHWWLSSRLRGIGNRCNGAMKQLQDVGGRQLDGLQASAQQLMPWPQLQVQRRSALRVRVLSCTMHWPHVKKSCLELNLSHL